MSNASAECMCVANYASARVSCHSKSYNGVTGAQALLRLYIMIGQEAYHAHCGNIALSKRARQQDGCRVCMSHYNELEQCIRDVASPARAVKRMQESELHLIAMSPSVNVTGHSVPPPEDSPTPPPQGVFLDCGHATNDLRQDCRKAADVNTVVVGVGEDTEMGETTAEKLRRNKASDNQRPYLGKHQSHILARAKSSRPT